ncbi:hypothetical protein HN873_021391, partial [Arachis hypogaea]
MDLSDNKLVGPIARVPPIFTQSLANCTLLLKVLDLAHSNIEDAFPSWIETLQELK